MADSAYLQAIFGFKVKSYQFDDDFTKAHGAEFLTTIHDL